MVKRNNYPLFVAMYVFGMLLACTPQTAQPAASEPAKPSPTVRVIASDTGFGYEIWVEGKRVILQRHVPAVQGKQPFPDSVLARKTGELCAGKIRDGIFPPSLSLAEVEEIFAAEGENLPTVP